MNTTTPITSASLQPPKKKSGVRRRYTTLRPPRRSISDNNKKEIIKEMETGDTAYSVLVDTVAGIFGGVAGKAVEYPADTVKVKLQAQTTTGQSYNGVVDCVRQTIKQGGVRSLYAGLPVPLLGSMLEMGVLFTAMGRIKHYTSVDPENPTLLETCISGGGAGVCASFVLTPVELIKCRLQTRNYSGGAMDCIRSSLKEEGAFVFYKGFVGTILREVPGTAAWFGMYEMSLSILCPNQKEEDPKSWQVIAAGGVGGMGYWGAFYPADTVKTEMQTITTTMSNIKQPSFIETFRTIYKTRGMNGLYAGLGPTLLRAIPANAAVFYVYDVVSKAMLGGKKK